MTRLQKKCMVFSLGLHGLLGVVLLASSGFRSVPPPSDLQLITMVPANIVDRIGSGGGTQIVNPAPQAQPQPPPQPQQPQRQPAPTPPVAERTPVPTPHVRKEPEPDKSEKPDKSEEVTLEPTRVKRHTAKPVEVSYTPVNGSKNNKKSPKTASAPTAASSARSNARAKAEALALLNSLAQGVKNTGSSDPIVDTAGIGGGEAYAGYINVVYSTYYHAWVAPDSIASRSAVAKARVTVLRDGTITSFELTSSSDDRALDKSVEQALRRVTKLPPFPAESHDTQRTFALTFSPEVKDESG